MHVTVVDIPWGGEGGGRRRRRRGERACEERGWRERVETKGGEKGWWLINAWY
jgi:hypothetical protein